MSVCGGCPYPFEQAMAGEVDGDDEPCGFWGCSHEDAAYRAQWAYDQLMNRYKELEEKYKKLSEEKHIMEDDGK